MQQGTKEAQNPAGHSTLVNARARARQDDVRARSIGTIVRPSEGSSASRGDATQHLLPLLLFVLPCLPDASPCFPFRFRNNVLSLSFGHIRLSLPLAPHHSTPSHFAPNPKPSNPFYIIKHWYSH
jgi:hypothetical protein